MAHTRKLSRRFAYFGKVSFLFFFPRYLKFVFLGFWGGRDRIAKGVRARRQYTDAGFGDARRFAAGLAFELSGAGVVARAAAEYLPAPPWRGTLCLRAARVLLSRRSSPGPARAAISMTSAFRTNPTVYYWCISFLLGVRGAWDRIAVSGRARDPGVLSYLSFFFFGYIVFGLRRRLV